MKKYKIIQVKSFYSVSALKNKTEELLNTIESEGKYDIVSVSFNGNNAFITVSFQP